VRHCGRCLVGVHGDPHQLGAGAREILDLTDGRLDVGRDCTAMGAPPPTTTAPMRTGMERRRGSVDMPEF
jgi:hypothetical protein